jgi:hypothetical protein
MIYEKQREKNRRIFSIFIRNIKVRDEHIPGYDIGNNLVVNCDGGILLFLFVTILTTGMI